MHAHGWLEWEQVTHEEQLEWNEQPQLNVSCGLLY